MPSIVQIALLGRMFIKRDLGHCAKLSDDHCGDGLLISIYMNTVELERTEEIENRIE